MKKILFSLCLIASTCSAFAAVNNVSSDKENSGGIVKPNNASSCRIEEKWYRCFWIVKNNCDTPAIVATGDQQQFKTTILPKNSFGISIPIPVNKGNSLNFSATLNGVTKTIRAEVNNVTINKSPSEKGGFKLTLSY